MLTTISELIGLAKGFENWSPAHQAELKAMLPDLYKALVRENLIEFSNLCGFSPAKHHRLIIRELEQLANRTNDRLILTLPPGAAKSTYASMLFPPHSA